MRTRARIPASVRYPIHGTGLAILLAAGFIGCGSERPTFGTSQANEQTDEGKDSGTDTLEASADANSAGTTSASGMSTSAGSTNADPDDSGPSQTEAGLPNSSVSSASASESTEPQPSATQSAEGSTSIPDAAMIPSLCGNGAVDGEEKCDDSNALAGDGCNETCHVERGWGCDQSEPSECKPICGDGRLVGKEAEAGGCDDENIESQDGCSSKCKVEAGYACTDAPSLCAETCGDGTLDDGEECDDGNGDVTDGCIACAVVTGFECDNTMSPSTCADVNECDDAATCGAHEVCTNTAGGFACACSGGYVGTAGACVLPSCSGLAANCGASLSDNCCTSLIVEGGNFGLGDPAESAATIATFALDKYEVTVGRFRKFVEAYDGPPVNGAGAHPLIADSGWQSAWDSQIAANAIDLAAAVQCDSAWQTWNATGANDRLPMNCVSWYEAFAFCAWDGGRLPIEAEWEYAAAGGDEERIYPWGGANPTSTLAVYYCTGDGSAANDCTFSDLQPAGSRPAGSGRYGQLDLAGSMWEWNLDWYGDLESACSNCANVSSGSFRVIRGGDWNYDASNLLSAYRNNSDPTAHYSPLGVRCSRTPKM